MTVAPARANRAAGFSLIVALRRDRLFIYSNHDVRHFLRILDRPGSRQYVARGLLGQVDFASISSDGFFQQAVCALFASGEAPSGPEPP
jgi:hypothetical protein